MGQDHQGSRHQGQLIASSRHCGARSGKPAQPARKRNAPDRQFSAITGIFLDRKIVPFERIPDHAGSNYSASLCGVHLTPSVCARPTLSHGISLVNFFTDVNGASE